MKTKILFLPEAPQIDASSRTRVYNYKRFLEKAGFDITIIPYNSFIDAWLNAKNRKRSLVVKVVNKINQFLKCVSYLVIVWRYDAIYIHRILFPKGVFKGLRILGKKIIFDFDDAIYLATKSRSNNFVERFKSPNKASYIVKISDRIIAGNSLLSDFVKKFNKNVKVIPTCVDTDIYNNNDAGNKRDVLTIGWIGSATTAEYLNELRGIFIELAKKYPCLNFKIIGGELKIDGLDTITSKKWRLEDEISDLRSIDIGIMPMPDSDWTRGKCGFKALLYMSMQIPCVCSPVGVNKEIIQDGVNGFLALSEREWIDKLSALIENEDLRKRIGRAGRETVEESFSVKVNVPIYLDALTSV